MDEDKNVIRVITVRLPKAMHLELKDLAAEKKISLNQLCLDSLRERLDFEADLFPGARRSLIG